MKQLWTAYPQGFYVYPGNDKKVPTKSYKGLLKYLTKYLASPPIGVTSLTGKLYGDKGYLSKALSDELLESGVELVTNVRKNMNKKVISLWDKAMLKKRFLIETINDQLKNISYVHHIRHQSINGFMLNMLAGLIAYCLKENKPSIELNEE